jgi:peptide/nickel transport system substrate-binding protein
MRKSVKAFVGLALVGVALGSFGLSGVAGAQKFGGTLKLGMQTDPVGLDPHTSNATSTRNQLENVYDTLVAVDSSGRIVSSLAKSWRTSGDGLTWTFELRSGVKFHDGSDFTADDVAFSINRIKDPAIKSPRASDFGAVTAVTAVDKDTVQFKLNKPYSPLLSKLANSQNVIVAKEAVATINSKPVGTGPFEFVEYIPQVRMVLKKNPNFWGRDGQDRQLPYLDGMVYSYIPDATARTTALRSGAVDWIEYVPSADVTTLRKEPNLRVVGGLSTNYRALYFNVANKPFDNPLVRQAIAYAVDRKEIVDVALFGVGGVAATGANIPPKTAYSVTGPYNTPNIEKAKQLLTQAGFPNGLDMNLYVTSTYDFLRTPAEIIQAQLAKIGVRVKITAEEWSVYLPKVLNKQYDVTILGSSGAVDPDDYLYSAFKTGSNSNLDNFSDSQVDTLLEQGRSTSGASARDKIYAQIQNRLLELSPMVYLFHSTQFVGLTTRVRGFEHFPNTSYISLRRTWIN